MLNQDLRSIDVFGAHLLALCDRNVSTRDWLIFVQGGQRWDVAGGFGPWA